jgi:Tol biopolymer transport system component
MPEDPYGDIRAGLADAASDVDTFAPVPDRAVRRARRRAAVNVAIVCLAVVAIAGGSLHVIRASMGTHHVPAVHPTLHRDYRLVNVSSGSVAPFPVPTGGSWFRFSPDGSQVIFVKNDAAGLPQLFRMRADGSDLTKITPDPEWESQADEPAWSPNGRWIAFRGMGQIIAVQPDGYHPPRAGQSWATNDASAPSWSSDGKKLAYVNRGSIWITVEDYYAPRSVTSGPPHRIVSAGTSPAWSPRGDQIAFTSGRGPGRRVAIVNGDGANVREIAGPTSDHPTWSPDGRTLAYDVWNSDGDVAVWLFDLQTGKPSLLLNDASVESWKNEGTLLVSTYLGE